MIPKILDARVRAAAPIDGISVGRLNDKSTWRIDFKSEATFPERQAAQAVLTAFNVVLEEQKIVDKRESRRTSRDRIRLLPPNTSITVADLLEAEII